MSFHLSAKPGEIAETVLLPGDPLRAKFIAETMLENAVCYNHIRNMFGFTGFYKGKRVSIQGTWIGMPSLAIYA
ncbi:MAG: purine-nucleoside phosphorylase, partial [candidate division KSB1 bacterium]